MGGSGWWGGVRVDVNAMLGVGGDVGYGGKREKVKSSIFRRYMLPWKPVVRSRQISNPSKLSCMISLPASMKRIRSRTAEKKWRHCFLIISLWGFFQTFKGSSLRSRWSNQTEIQTHPSSHACHHCLQL